MFFPVNKYECSKIKNQPLRYRAQTIIETSNRIQCRHFAAHPIVTN